MASNRTIAADFAAQKKSAGKGSSFYYEGNVLYSYGPHFPVAVIRGTRAFFNSDGYSPTTSRHKSYAQSALQSAGYVFTMRTTAELQEMVRA